MDESPINYVNSALVIPTAVNNLRKGVNFNKRNFNNSQSN